jgi:TPP-dependent 2-oxoacid decarboxylase
MESIITPMKYIEWISAEDMHKNSLRWLSELRFIKDEHVFFEHLVNDFSCELEHVEELANDKEVIDAISRSCRRTDQLIQNVMLHERKLNIMVDGIDQLKDEKIYREEHRKLWIEIDDFAKEYRHLKAQVFNIIKDIKKDEKLRILCDNKL